jgi:hypothetical protein
MGVVSKNEVEDRNTPVNAALNKFKLAINAIVLRKASE